MKTATRQPLGTFVMIETAKRLLSADEVWIHPDNVVRCSRFLDEGHFQAVQFGPNGTATMGWWLPDGIWDDPCDVRSGESGKFMLDV